MTTTAPALTLGQSVLFTRTLTRRSEEGPNGWRQHLKVWKSEAWPGQPEPEQRMGIVIGVRTLSNGENRYHGYDDGGIEYKQTETFTAYLIAHDLRRKPVLVLPEHITPTGDPA